MKLVLAFRGYAVLEKVLLPASHCEVAAHEIVWNGPVEKK